MSGERVTPILDAAEKQRQAIAERQARFDKETQRDFERVWQRTREKIANLPDKPGRKAIRQLAAEVEADVDRFSKLQEKKLRIHQTRLAELGERAAVKEITGKPKASIKKPKYDDLIDNLSNGQPMRTLLQELAIEARVNLGKLPLGKTRDEIEALARERMGVTLTRSITISQTESMRVYNEVQGRIYQANASAVPGWIWVARLNARTCGACWAMHGSWHPVTQRLHSHPRCRCVAIPATRAQADAMTDGSEAFAKLDAEQQDEILGPGKGRAIRAGSITLADLVDLRGNPDGFPAMVTEKSLKRAIA